MLIILLILIHTSIASSIQTSKNETPEKITLSREILETIAHRLHSSVSYAIQNHQHETSSQNNSPSEQFFENIKKCYSVPNINCASCALTGAGAASEQFILALAKDRFYCTKTAIFTQYEALTGDTINSTLTNKEEKLLAQYVKDFLKNYNTKKSAHLFHQTRNVTCDSSSSEEDDNHSREQTPEYHSDDDSCQEERALCNPCVNKAIHEQKITSLQAKTIQRELRNIFNDCAKTFVNEINSYIHDYTELAENYMFSILSLIIK